MEENNSDMNIYQKEYEKYYYSLQKQAENDKKDRGPNYKNQSYKARTKINKKYDLKGRSKKNYEYEDSIEKSFDEEAYDDSIIEKKLYSREKEKKRKTRVDKFILQLGVIFVIMLFYVGSIYIYPPVFNDVKTYTQKYCFSHELEYQNLYKRYNDVNWEAVKDYIINNYNYLKGEIRSLL